VKNPTVGLFTEQVASNKLGLSCRGSGEVVTFFDKFSRLFSSVFQRTGVSEIHAIRQNTPPDERDVDAAEQSVASLTASVASQNVSRIQAGTSGSRDRARSLVCLVPVLLNALDVVDLLGMLPLLSA
jgi:hypothetical protein